MTFPTVPQREFRTLDEVVRALPDLKWRTQEAPGGGRTAFCILSGNKETGEIHVFAVIENGAAPAHEHVDGGPYGEMILTIAGEMQDATDDGKPVTLRPGDVLFHRGGTVHAPAASRFWFGYYHQPRGSRLK